MRCALSARIHGLRTTVKTKKSRHSSAVTLLVVSKASFSHCSRWLSTPQSCVLMASMTAVDEAFGCRMKMKRQRRLIMICAAGPPVYVLAHDGLFYSFLLAL